LINDLEIEKAAAHELAIGERDWRREERDAF
jgi:hypothetical protein